MRVGGCPITPKNGLVAIPSTFTSIPSQWFYGCKTITALEVPATVESIGSFAFEVND